MVTIRKIETEKDFEVFKNLQGDELHIVKLSAAWCGPCRTLQNVITNLDSEKIGTTLFAEIDVDDDEMENVCSELNVRNIPMLVYYKNGVEVKKTVGLQSAADIYKAINELQ